MRNRGEFWIGFPQTVTDGWLAFAWHWWCQNLGPSVRQRCPAQGCSDVGGTLRPWWVLGT
jgi:hypothetical protein